MVKVLIAAFIALTVIIVASKMAYSEPVGYTYDGDVDPIVFFQYDAINMEQAPPDYMIMSLASDTMIPEVAIAVCVVESDMVRIVAYIYIDEEDNLRRFLLNTNNHYVEEKLNPNAEIMMRSKLREILIIKRTGEKTHDASS